MWWTSTHVDQVLLYLLYLLGLNICRISFRSLREAHELLVVVDGPLLHLRSGACLPSGALQEGIQSSVCKSSTHSATTVDHPLGGYYWSLLSGRNTTTGD
jgi:hypothetical protein